MVTRYRALGIFGIVLALVTFSWDVVLLGGLNGENQNPQPIVITPMRGETFYEALQRTWQREIDGAPRKSFRPPFARSIDSSPENWAPEYWTPEYRASEYRPPQYRAPENRAPEYRASENSPPEDLAPECRADDL